MCKLWFTEIKYIFKDVIILQISEVFDLFNEDFYDGELKRPTIAVSPDEGRRAYGWCSINEIWNASGEKYREIARAMGVKNVDSMSQEEYRKAAVDAVKQLSKDVWIPSDLSEVGVQEKDIPFLAQSAMDDACRPGNPKDPTLEDIIALYKSML